MADIFNNTILCGGCSEPMEKKLMSRNGFNLRVAVCEGCSERIIHPADEREYHDFMRLKKKDFEVKMRMVGNSYAVSIPREIVDFMREQERMIGDMVRLSMQDVGRVSLSFGEEDKNQRVISRKEVKIIKD